MISFKRKSKRLFLFIFLFSLTGLLFTNCAGEGFSPAGEELTGTGDDPFLTHAWHIYNTGQKVFAEEEGGLAGFDLNLLQAWLSGLSGSGIRVVVSDDGVQDTHEDLNDNFLYGYSKNYHTGGTNNAPPNSPDDNHGTAVAGLVAAVSGNGVGTKGVAYGAKILSYNLLSSGVTQTTTRILDQLSGGHHIYNMSWGNTQNQLPDVLPGWETALLTGVTNGRGGKGSIYVKAAGNDFFVFCGGSTSDYCIGNSNFDPDNSSPYAILTTALNAQGFAASYSSFGSNVWVASFGGEYGDDAPAMVTTDRSGCSVGFSRSAVAGKVEFERGRDGNDACNYTTTFNGTSAAAPVLSGVVALLLEANPELNWRDVKYILAKTAVPVNATMPDITSHPFKSYPNNPAKNVILPPGAVWERGWVTNSVGFKFHNWYGFGKVDVDAAVAMAKNYTSTFTTALNATGWFENSNQVGIPDFNKDGVTSSISVGSNFRIEAVRIRLRVTHGRIGDLGLELTSPSGTKSMILNMRNSLMNVANYDNEVFLSNAFYQERSGGTWTLRVVDGGSTFSGTLDTWGIQIIGVP